MCKCASKFRIDLTRPYYDFLEAQITGKLTPEQMYAETKFLLFTIIKSLPEDEVNSKECSTVERTLGAAWKYAKERNDKVSQIAHYGEC